MTVDELNNYIKHYLEEDKTRTAIMLTGEWGSGKTYYVENKLMPFLQKEVMNNSIKKRHKCRCIVISLYGLEELSDISKSIYMELRMKTLKKGSETLATGKLIAKTVAKGVAGKFGIDLNMSENDLEKIYLSVDLSGILLVFEDVERSNIELTKLFGYVNNLVEQDGVKVLLVTNEYELLNKVPEVSDIQFLLSSNFKIDNNKISKVVHNYLKIKEKTISDTICFEIDYHEAVRNIVKTFDNEIIKKIILKDDNEINEIVSILKRQCHENFRTFIFATQKTVDIYEKLVGNFDEDFLKCIYYGIIVFSTKIKDGEFPKWQGTDDLSTILGSRWNPLFKFCYDYIDRHRLDLDKINYAEKAYHKMRLYDKRVDRCDIDLQKIYSYHVRTEEELRNVLGVIEERLKTPDDIGFYSYGKLAAYLVKIKHVIGFDYTQCKQCMAKNLRGRGDDIDSNFLFLPMDDFEGEEKEEFDKFVKELSDSMNAQYAQYSFSYDPNDIVNLYDYIIRESEKISEIHMFISKFNIDKTVEMLFHATSKQISDFREMLFQVYRDAGKKGFIKDEIVAMRRLKTLISRRIDSQNYDLDKIQVQQLYWLCENLELFISRML